MNAVIYHGSFEAREKIRETEFYFADQASNPATRGQYKFHALITSYEVVKQDLDHLRKVPWPCERDSDPDSDNDRDSDSDSDHVTM